MLFCLEKNRDLGDLKAPPRCGFLMDSRGSPKVSALRSSVSAPKRLGGRPFFRPILFWGPNKDPTKRAMGENTTLWLCQQFAIENGPVEIVDFPIEYGDFPHLWTMLGHPSRRAKDAKALERSQVYHLPPCLRSGVIVFDALEVVVQLPTRGVMKTDGDNAILLEEFFQRYVPSTNFPIFCWFQKSWNILGMFSV